VSASLGSAKGFAFPEREGQRTFPSGALSDDRFAPLYLLISVRSVLMRSGEGLLSPLCNKSEKDSAISRTLFVHLVRTERFRPTTRWGIIMARGTSFASALLVGTASLSLIVGGITTTAAAQAATGSYRIESQPLGQALMQLSRQANVDIVAPAKITRGRVAKAVAAESVDAALKQMLSGSGLSYKLSGKRYVIQSGNVSSAAGQSGANPATPQRASTVQSQGRGTITGTVKDDTSGAALKGALVELVGTGRTTSTDNLGEFRFANVQAGDATVRISYLGYVEAQSTLAIGSGETYSEDFTLVGGNAQREIVVYGSRSARAQALNQERTAENVQTIISGDMLGDFNGTTISESLRRAPGVIFERDQETGDGTNIAIRGVAPDLNTVKFNGIELPESSGTGRSASLSNILTESISKVTISKTLLPNQDSSGTGGLVEIETKTPLDRPRRYLSVTLEGANRARDFNDELLAAGTASLRFGNDDRLGISASVQYRERDIKRVGYSADFLFGQFFPLQVDGTPSISSTLDVDPRLPFPFEAEADGVYPAFYNINRDRTKTSNLGVTFSAAAEIGDHTKLYADFQKLRQEDTSYIQGWSFNPFMQYSLMPVTAAGGEERLALEWILQGAEVRLGSTFSPNNVKSTDIYTLRGETNLGKLSLRYSGGYTKGSSKRSSYDFGPSGLFYDSGPASISPYILPDALDPVEGRIISPFSARRPGDDSFFRPLLSSAGYDVLNDPANYAIGSITYLAASGSNSRYTGQASARYEFGHSIFNYLEVGASYEDSTFRDRNDIRDIYDGINPVPLSDTGIEFNDQSLSDVGIDSEILFPGMNSLSQFFQSELPGISASCNPFSGPACPANARFYRTSSIDERFAKEFTKEKELAIWLQSRIDLGKLEIIGGARISRVDIDTLNLVGPNIFDRNFRLDVAFKNANTVLAPEKAKQTDILPRVLANYRLNDSIVLRGGYYLAVARPQISLLSKTPNISLFLAPSFGPNRNQPSLNIVKGNPDLKPSRTHNFDISAEYYDKDVGVAKFGFFYKRIDNLLESNVGSGLGVLEESITLLPSDPRFQDVIDNTSSYFVLVTTPVNNNDPAHIWGVEASIEKQFTFLPGVLSGLGFYGNYTYTSSSKNQPLTWQSKPVQDAGGAVIGFETVNIVVPDVRFDGQAKHSGTIGLTYNKYGVDANVAYTAQSRRQTSFDSFSLPRFEEAYATLDARIEYRTKLRLAEFSVYVEGTDLLRGPNDASIRTSQGADDGVTGKYYNSARYFGGRQLRAGFRATF
jgi:TonB-dependent receptor